MEAEPGPLLTRFQAQREAELSYARLRLTSAVLVGVSSLAVLLGRVPVAVFLVGALGLAVSLAWLVKARRSAQRARAPQDNYLAVYAHGLVWADGPRPPIWVAWDTVTGIEVDEERLDVCLSLKAAPALHIEPRYPGVEIHELVRRLRDAWREAGASPTP